MTEFTGGCTCRAVRYRLTDQPMIVHCCHCRWCQRETGASFALNAMIEFDRMELLQGAVEVIATPTNSGKGQRILGRVGVQMSSQLGNGCGSHVGFLEPKSAEQRFTSCARHRRQCIHHFGIGCSVQIQVRRVA